MMQTLLTLQNSYNITRFGEFFFSNLAQPEMEYPKNDFSYRI